MRSYIPRGVTSQSKPTISVEANTPRGASTNPWPVHNICFCAGSFPGSGRGRSSIAIFSWRASSAQEGHTSMSIASVKTRKAASSSWHLWHFSPILSDGEPLDRSENLLGKPRTTDSRPFDGELTAEPWLCPVEYDPRL